MKLSVSVLGPFQASLGSRPLAHFRTKKVQALLVYLLTEAGHRPGVGHNREALMELLWPGLPLKSAQGNLRQTVYQLRKTLAEAAGDTGHPFLSTNWNDIRVSPDFDYESDTAMFTHRLQAVPGPGKQSRWENLEQAIALYRGDFLSDFYLVDSTNFEEWAAARRSAFQQMALKALDELSAYKLERGEYSQAEAYLRRQLEIDPLTEQAVHQLVYVLALQGKRNAALTQFESYRQRLLDEHGLHPGKDLLDRVEQVRLGTDLSRSIGLEDALARPIQHSAKGDNEHRHDLVDGEKKGIASNAHQKIPHQRADFIQNSAPFFARQAQLEQLNNYLNAALDGQERVVVITGEAGTGKTALMHEFARRSQTSVAGLVAVKGTCNAITGTGDPYFPFREVFSSLARQFQAEIIEPWSSADTRELLFDRYTQALQQLSQRHPLLILLDDLQWADSASISLLFHLGRELEGSRVLIVGAYRPSEVRLSHRPAGEQQPHALATLVNEFKRLFGDIHVDLDHFSPMEGRALVDTYLDSADSLRPNRLAEEFRDKLFRKTRGHPLFMVELLREMQLRGDLVQDELGYWIEGNELDWNILPARVDAVIQQRISRLDPGLLEILSAASLEGEEFTVQVVGLVTGLDEQAAFQALSHELDKRHGLVREHGELQVGQMHLSRYQFSHALFQQFLSERLNPGEKRLLHAKIAGILEQIQGESGEAFNLQLAHHYSQAGNGNKAADYLLQAGDQARTLYAHNEATQHYQNAIKILLELGDHDAAAHALMKLGLTHHSAFDFDQARQAYAQGFKLWQQMDQRSAAPPKTAAPHPFRVAWQEPATLDPSMGGLNLTAPIVTQLFSGLVALSPDLEVVPDIAVSWEMLDEGRKYIFHLREKVYWTDGQPVTAADFEFTYKRAIDPASNTPIAGLLLDGLRGARDVRQGKTQDACQVGVYASDDLTLVIELEEPVSYFLQQLTYYVLLPVPQHRVQMYGAAWADAENIVTNGPFMLTEWDKGKSMLLERYPHYHGRMNGNLEQVQLTLGLTPNEQIERYEAGQQDILNNWFLSSANMVDPIRRKPEQFRIWPQFATLYIIVNPGIPPFDDKSSRQALAYALDRDDLISMTNKGQDLPATGGFTPPGMPGHTEEGGLIFDPQKAQILFQERRSGDAGAFSAAKMMISPVREEMASFMIEKWREILNIDISLDIRRSGSFMDDLYQSQPALALGGWWADYADPENFLRVCVQMDVPEWHHPVYESLLEQARLTTDQDLRMDIYRQADRILMDEAVIIPLVYVQKLALLQPWVKNYRSTAVKHPGFWKDVVIDPHD